MKARILAFCAMAVFAPACWAAPVPSPLFSDHAVLQRNVPLPVWGTADPAEKITVRYRGAAVETTADAEGRWRVTLPPLPAGPGEKLTVEGKGVFSAADVAVGDVWICSGQSNMEWPVEKSDGFAAVKERANQPWLREIKVPHFAAQTPQTSFKAAWRVCSPETVGTFSAVAYQFVSQLYPDGNVPVGILNLSYGGTRVEQWMSPEALTASPFGKDVLGRWAAEAAAYPALQAKYEKDLPAWEQRQKEALAAGKKFAEKPPVKPPGRAGHYTQPSALHFGMVSAVAGFPASGFVWYQGESNVLRPEEYESLLASFLTDVRKIWSAEKLPLFVVQLPLFDERKLPGYRWAQIRQAQAQAAEALPGAHLAVTVDLGNPLDKHPTDKTEVGRRLARLAMREVFDKKIPAHAPKVKGARVSGDSVQIDFDADGSSLELRGDGREEKAFEIAGADGVFHPATATLKDDHTVLLRASSVPAPAQARYLQYDVPRCTLFSKEGLPAQPFVWKAGS